MLPHLRTALVVLMWGIYTVPTSSSLLACTHQEARDATDTVLGIAQIACIETSALTDEDALATACKIVNTPLLKSLLHALIGQREAGKRAGFVWPAQDAGISDAGRD